MPKQSSSSFQNLGNGVFRVGGTVSRSAVSGRYISGSSASRFPRTTVAESKAKSSTASNPRPTK